MSESRTPDAIDSGELGDRLRGLNERFEEFRGRL
jgi:hypothetical protein